MNVSVIVSTYNSPKWLEKVIWGYAVQERRPAEVIIADDGSTAETASMVTSLRSTIGLPLRHVWHEDRGFRKSRILNHAVRTADCEYLIFTDGDCIPRRDFVAQHVRLARRNRFLSGGVARLPWELSRRVSVADVTSGRATDLGWLRREGWSRTRKRLLLCRSARWAAALDRLTTTRATWNGHNASGWKSDIVAVNGFDERMQYGGLDRELGERLINRGVVPCQVRHRTACVHLEHLRNYVGASSLRDNLLIRRDTVRRRMTWTRYGIRAVSR